MTGQYGHRWMSGISAFVVLGALSACRADAGDSDLGDRGVALAQPGPAPAVATATPVAVTTPYEPPKVAVKNVTYTDAEAVFRKGQYRDAAELFDSFVAAHPRSGSGHYMLGLAAWKAGDHPRAERALTRAVELDGESVKARTNLSRVLLEQGRATEALPHMEKAVEVAPESHEVWRVLGNVKSELGRGEEALFAYRRALTLNDRDWWSMNNYGLVLIHAGRYEEAVPPLARAVELLPTSPVFQNNLGIALERMGELGGARQAFDAALKADSGFVRARVSLERVLHRLGEFEPAPFDVSAPARMFVEQLESWRPLKASDAVCAA